MIKLLLIEDDTNLVFIEKARWKIYKKSIKLLHNRKKTPKGVSFSDFICTFAISFRVLLFFAALR